MWTKHDDVRCHRAGFTLQRNLGVMESATFCFIYLSVSAWIVKRLHSIFHMLLRKKLIHQNTNLWVTDVQSTTGAHCVNK